MSIDNNRVLLFRYNNFSDEYIIEERTFEFYRGDIVKIDYLIEEDNKKIKHITLLNRPKRDPFDDRASVLNKLIYLKSEILQRREEFFYEIRNYFKRNSFLEIHSPTLVESPGVEYYIEPFETTYYDIKRNKRNYYLPTSPEFALKEALVAGLENIFEIAKVFRNQGEDSHYHNPEFFMLEWYRSYKSYYDTMNDCENLIKYLAKKILKSTKHYYSTAIIDLSKTERIKLKKIFKNYNINLDNYTLNPAKFINEVKAHYNEDFTFFNKDDVFFKFFMDKVEPNLGFEHPIIVYDYPIEMCPLSEPCSDDTIYGARFELYICGVEIANGFQELTDVDVQKKNFSNIINFRKDKSIAGLEMPERFIKNLEYGLPPSSGVALGIERLFMIFEDVTSIKQCNIF